MRPPAPGQAGYTTEHDAGDQGERAHVRDRALQLGEDVLEVASRLIVGTGRAGLYSDYGCLNVPCRTAPPRVRRPGLRASCGGHPPLALRLGPVVELAPAIATQLAKAVVGDSSLPLTTSRASAARSGRVLRRFLTRQEAIVQLVEAGVGPRPLGTAALRTTADWRVFERQGSRLHWSKTAPYQDHYYTRVTRA